MDAIFKYKFMLTFEVVPDVFYLDILRSLSVCKNFQLFLMMKTVNGTRLFKNFQSKLSLLLNVLSFNGLHIHGNVECSEEFIKDANTLDNFFLWKHK